MAGERTELESAIGDVNKLAGEDGVCQSQTVSEADPILEVEGLFLSFMQYGTGLRQRNLEVIHDLSLSAHAGEVVAVVGASGSGKSLLAHAIFGILPDNAQVAGSIRFRG